MTFSDIGKEVKAAYSEYDHLSDYQAGKAYALEHFSEDKLLRVEDDSIELLPSIGIEVSNHKLSVATDAHVALGWRTSHLGKQIDHIGKQYEKDHAIRQGEFDHSVSGERMLRAYYLEKAQYVVNVLNSRAQAQDFVASQQLTAEALKYGFDKVSYLVFRLRQIDTDEQLRLRGEQFRQDQQNKEELDRIQRENEAKTTANKIAAATQAKLGRLQQERAIDEAHDKALREAHEIANGNDPPELKKRRLAAKEQTIASLERQLDGLRREPREDDFRPEPRWRSEERRVGKECRSR